MELVQKIAAFLAKCDWLSYIFLGIAMMQLLKVLNFYPPIDSLKYSFWVIAPCWLSIDRSCSIFYADKYDDYTKNLGPLISIPFSDTYFYQTITSDIGTYRKIAGYVYVADKVIAFCFIGGLFHFASVVIATKH